MKDEIKEIYLSNTEWTKTHDNMGGVIGNCIFKNNMSYEEYTKLCKNIYFVLCNKDYITTLQEENEKLKEENKHIFANVNDDELLRSNAMNWAEANKLQQRINKAIEYVEENITSFRKIELLNILQGDDNNAKD